jgi:CheY-like chemotaxis protein
MEYQPVVLVVDDYAPNVLALGVALRPLGAQVLEANSGAAAVTCAEEVSLDAILMDVRMPGLSGFDACDRIQRTMNRHTPVLFHTAEELTVAERERALALGARNIVKKPVSSEELVRELRALLRKP